MDLKVEMFVKRARTEIDSAEILFQASENKKLKDHFSVNEDSTFYSGVISHSYYTIFYCAKAMLLTKKMEPEAPEVHKKAFDQFKEVFIDSGLLDAKLLMIYRALIVRAEALLDIYKAEKKKRGDFTYNTIPQANRLPAEESIKHAKEFFKHCDSYLSN